MLISQDSRRIECEPTAEHHHVWLDKGMVLIAQPPRFNTRQAARKSAIRAGMEAGQLRGEAVCAPVSVHGEAEAEAEAEEVSPLWAASLNKGEATMNASTTQTYAKAVRDLAEAAQMIQGATTAEGKEARVAVEKATKNVADLISASDSGAWEE